MTIEELEDELKEVYDELEDVKCELSEYENCVDPIKNSEHFITQLKIENLYNNELEEFIQKYMRFYND